MSTVMRSADRGFVAQARELDGLVVGRAALEQGDVGITFHDVDPLGCPTGVAGDARNPGPDRDEGPLQHAVMVEDADDTVPIACGEV